MAINPKKNRMGVFTSVGKNFSYLQMLSETVKYTKGDLELFILNFGQDEDSVKLCKILARRRNINLRFVNATLSRSEAWNQLFAWAIEEKYEQAVFCDPETIFHSSCIDTLAAHLEQNPKELIACAVDAKRIVEVVQQFPFFSPDEIKDIKQKGYPIKKFKEALGTIQLGTPLPVPHYELVDYGCFMARPQAVLESVGSFDEQYIERFWEDLDMHWRLADQDIRTGSIVNAIYVNLKVEDVSEGPEVDNIYIPNGFYFAKKHGLTFRNDQLIKRPDGSLRSLKQFESKEAFTAYENELDKKIYDCFVFEDDLDLLELRLKLLSPYVDQFIVIEATETLAGKKKKLYLKENKDRFAEYSSKIKRLVLQDFKNLTAPEERQTFLIRALSAGLKGARFGDIVMVSRTPNQIPNLRRVREFIRMSGTRVCLQKGLLGTINVTDKSVTEGTRLATVGSLRDDYGGDMAALVGSTGFKITSGGLNLKKASKNIETQLVKGKLFLEKLTGAEFTSIPDIAAKWFYVNNKHVGYSFVDAEIQLYDN